MHTHKYWTATWKWQLSRDESLYCFVLSRPRMISVLHQSAMIKINRFTAKGKRNTIYIGEWYSLFHYFSGKKRGGGDGRRSRYTLSFLHASIKAQFVSAFLKIAFCLSFLMFFNLSVKVATFSQRHMPIFAQDKYPCKNNKQKVWNCHKIKPDLK